MNITDEYGCVYSSDSKLLLEINEQLETYTIKQGTEAICFYGEYRESDLQNIVIPDSVTHIED